MLNPPWELFASYTPGCLSLKDGQLFNRLVSSLKNVPALAAKQQLQVGLFHYLHRPSTMGRKLFFGGGFYFEMRIALVCLNGNELKTYVCIYRYTYIYIIHLHIYYMYIKRVLTKLGEPFLSSSSLAKLNQLACIKAACFSSVIWKRKEHLIFLHCLARKREAIWLMNSLVLCWWLKNATGKGDMIQPQMEAVIFPSWVTFIWFLVFKICS